MANGLASAAIAPAAQAVQAAGRAPDTLLAHVSPDEAQFIDMLQGGRRVNPHTGLPEYGMFGDILKAVARAAGAIGGFMVAGPAGAAAGAGAATKLTGGSWKDALSSAALSGVGSFAAQGLGGGGWSAIGKNNPVAGLSPTLQNAAPNSIPLSAIGSTPVSSPGFLQVAKSAPGLAAAAGGLMGAPLDSGQNVPPMQMPPPNKINLNVVPQPRTYRPFTGDPLRFAEPGQGGQGFEFYNPLNPQPIYQSAGGPVNAQPMNTDFRFRHGGAVHMAMGGNPAVAEGPYFGPRGVRAGGAQMPAVPSSPIQAPTGGIGDIGHNENMIRRAALMGYSAAGGMPGMGMARGGDVHGPGDGRDDAIPAQLSAGEHIVDAQTISLLGRGDNDAGQRRMEMFKTMVRAKAGQKNPQKPGPDIGDPRAMMRRAIGKGV